MAKNVFLSKDKNLLRKFEEIYLALQIEKHFTKAEILTLYLNVVEFGENLYGVKAACRHYFNRQPSEVTPEQGAFLAFLLPNPKKYSQSYLKKKMTPFAEKMVRTILHKMELGHKISQEEYMAAVGRVSQFPWTGSEPPTNLQDTTESPMGVGDESNQNDNDFKFDFTPDENP